VAVGVGVRVDVDVAVAVGVAVGVEVSVAVGVGDGPSTSGATTSHPLTARPTRINASSVSSTKALCIAGAVRALTTVNCHTPFLRYVPDRARRPCRCENVLSKACALLTLRFYHELDGIAIPASGTWPQARGERADRSRRGAQRPNDRSNAQARRRFLTTSRAGLFCAGAVAPAAMLSALVSGRGKG